MEILNLIQNSVPLSSSYIGDTDIELIKNKIITEDGLVYFKEKYLDGVNDRTVNNYSALFLTKKEKLDEFINLIRLEYPKTQIFTTSFKDYNSTYFLTVSTLSSETHELYLTTSSDKFIDEQNRHFEVILLDTSYLSARIVHRWNGVPYYLTYDGGFYFSSVLVASKATFNYGLDEFGGKMALFYKTSSFCISADTLALTSNSDFRANFFNINYYPQVLEPRLNTSWVSYDKTKKNQYTINPSKSRNDLKNNYLFNTEYSYVTGDEIKVNFLTLKNQNTHKNYANRSDYLELRNDGIPNVDNRDYRALITGNDQELGDHNISFTYELYNTDYVFEADKYTVFYTPESLYPYEQININDLKWSENGSIGGDTPYTSDRIYRKKVNDGSSDGEYVCTWLRRNRDGTYTWLDRYYYPSKTSFATALSTSFTDAFTDPVLTLLNTSLSSSEYYDVNYIFESIYEEYENTPQTPKSALYGIAFFDKKSDLVIQPNSEYIYYRIGTNYTKIVLDTIKDALVESGLSLKNLNGSTIEVNGDEYQFTGSEYAIFQSYSAINIEHECTFSFWLKSDDWSKKFGHQIMGNLNETGFAVQSDRKVTPFITVQNNKDIFVYNTDFDLLDDASLTNEKGGQTRYYKIKDMYRTDHLESFYTITID